MAIMRKFAITEVCIELCYRSYVCVCSFCAKVVCVFLSLSQKPCDANRACGLPRAALPSDYHRDRKRNRKNTESHERRRAGPEMAVRMNASEAGGFKLLEEDALDDRPCAAVKKFVSSVLDRKDMKDADVANSFRNVSLN
ncbi:hypothetical protein PoB_000540300 [Plakobranchus ocellatus]|uniref:Uncharacterized protein n=1 Tax=Plakobranchus ocellatus TaxID=259542 RepID=A0AAV3Y8Y3_9GAST|nr:hypothetical protein PoB_000540300 [Plakobranchus ocellatus]